MRILHFRSVGLAAAIAGAAVALMVLYSSVERIARAQQGQVPDTYEVQVALHRVSLTPEALAAAGLSSGEVATLVGDTVSYLSEHASPISLDQACGEVTSQCRQLERVIRSGRGTEADVAALNAARAQRTMLQGQRDAALQNLFDAVTEHLSGQKRQALATIRAQQQEWAQPTPFLAVDLSEADRVRLRNALANERIAAKYGETPDPEAQAFLQEVRSLPAVALAQANLDANALTIQVAWAEAVQP